MLSIFNWWTIPKRTSFSLKKHSAHQKCESSGDRWTEPFLNCFRSLLSIENKSDVIQNCRLLAFTLSRRPWNCWLHPWKKDQYIASRYVRTCVRSVGFASNSLFLCILAFLLKILRQDIRWFCSVFRPWKVRKSFNADAHIEYFELILGYYENLCSNVAALIGDNCPTTQSVKTKTDQFSLGPQAISVLLRWNSFF